MSTPTRALAVPVLQQIIWDRYMQLLGVKRRLHVVRAFADELDHVKRGKPWRNRNSIVGTRCSTCATSL